MEQLLKKMKPVSMFCTKCIGLLLMSLLVMSATVGTSAQAKYQYSCWCIR